MSIINITTSQAGLVGVLPSIAYIDTNNTEAEVLTAGYFNHAVEQGFSFSLPCIAIISTRTTPTAAPVLAWYQIIHSGGNWSATSTASPGAVTLPTIANHIATYTNTIGGLSEDAATAINAGNIQAGLSGTAGYLASFPGTAARGSLRLVGAISAGDTVTTITNASQAAARTYTIPDAGAASNFLMTNSGGTQTIATGSLALTLGNLTVAAGNISATLGSIAAGTTVTAGTGITATTGNISAIAGNVIAGASGAAGTLISFPATAANGSLIISALNAGGAFNTTIRNSAMGQSTVYSIPDIGAATGGIVASTTPFIVKSVAGAAAAGGAAAQSFTDAFCTSGSNVIGNWNTQANAASVLKIVPGNGSFVVTSSADAGVGTFNYIITK